MLVSSVPESIKYTRLSGTVSTATVTDRFFPPTTVPVAVMLP